MESGLMESTESGAALFARLLETFDVLMGENGCPWDREQTHGSIRGNLLEEAQEAAEAIDSGDAGHMAEELGDVLLQVIFHAKIAEKNGGFNMDDIMRKLLGKLVARHTHVFGGDTASTAEEALLLWERNKKKSRQ